ncbi:MAG TPA: hypothetical protein DCS93_39890 [Microscillaceae bacterium]|nr:hypothetical protein [Microscillaceae bacterium]
MRIFIFSAMLILISLQGIGQDYRYVNVPKAGLKDKPSNSSEAFIVLYAPCRIQVSQVVGLENSPWVYAHFITEKKEEYDGYVWKKDLVKNKQDITIPHDEQLMLHYSFPNQASIRVDKKLRRKKASQVAKVAPKLTKTTSGNAGGGLQVISDGKGTKKRIGILRRMMNLLAECTLYENAQGKAYLVTFNDDKYTKIKSLEGFTLYGDQELDQLYQISLKGFKDMPERAIILKLREGTLALYYSRLMGVKMLQYAYTENGVTSWVPALKRWQIRKLFGKKR